MNWLESYLALCGAMSPLGKVVLLSDLAIALAYFAIPISLLIFRRVRFTDIPYPWMFALFAAFIVACGLTHVVHAVQMPWTTFEHTVAEASVKVICAVLSVGTAVALIIILPAALRLVSPRARQEELERLVQERTLENRLLLREINHRLGNQLQVISSAIRIERRRATSETDHQLISRIAGVVEELVVSYREDQQRYGLPPPLSEGQTILPTRVIGAQSNRDV